MWRRWTAVIGPSIILLMAAGGIIQTTAQLEGALFTPHSTNPSVALATPAPRLTQTNHVPAVDQAPHRAESAIPSPTGIWNPPGYVEAPILFYHHIAEAESGSRYYVSPDQFEAEMQALEDWGYHTISISDLIEAMMTGATLPAHPIVITFDDGDLSVYQNAFPIMQEHNFDGVFYIVSSYLDAPNFVTRTELLEMIADGWEIGCHSANHPDLTQAHNQLRAELLDARQYLESQLGVEIRTFAYPFGQMDTEVVRKLIEYGYTGGVGLGTYYQHTPATLYYLSRIEIHGGIDLASFASLLPWRGYSSENTPSIPASYSQIR